MRVQASAWIGPDSSGAWFRINGHGLSFSTAPLLFSERYNQGRRVLRIGRLKIERLRP